MNKLLVATLTMLLLPVTVLADVTPQDVVDKMKSGDVKTAEMFTKQILKDHPDSAKGHYYMGQILAVEGNYRGSYSELKKSAELDKSLSFASSPDKFREEMDKVKMNLGRAEAPPISNVKDEGWGWFTWLLLLGLGGSGVWYFFIRKPEEKETKKDEPVFKPNPAANHPAYASAPSQAQAQPTVRATTGSAYSAPSYAAPHVVNNYNSNNDGLVEGMIIGSMMAGRGSNNTIIDRETIIERDTTTNNVVPETDFDSGSDNTANENKFDAGSDDTTSFDSGSSDFDSGSSSFDSGGSSFDSGSSGGGDW